MFLLERNFIYESLLVVGQMLVTKRQAFCFHVVINLCKKINNKNKTILDTERSEEYKISFHERTMSGNRE
jgi:hypothetical protein